MPLRIEIKSLFRRSVKTDLPGQANSAESISTAKSITQQTINPKQSPRAEDQRGKTATPQLLELKGLWKEAYEELYKEDARLIEAYEDALLQQDDLGSQKSSAESDTDTRLRSLVERRFEEIEGSRLKIIFAGKEITVREQARRAIDLIVSLKPSIAVAVGADPHAALAWAGFMLLLAPISRTLTQDEIAMEGFEYILKILVQYRVLESTHVEIYLNESTPKSNDVKPLDELGSSIRSQTVKLYVAVLRYQMRLAQHFAQSGFLRFFADLKITDNWDSMLQTIKKVDESINRELNTVSGNTLRQIEREVQRLHCEIAESHHVMREALGETKAVKNIQLLDSLTTASGAAFNSYENRNKPQCLEDTQTRALERIQSWCASSNRNIYWLRGMAGTGKSTIARTFAAACLNRQSLIDGSPLPDNTCLGASFFFDQNERDRNSPRNLFTTLCRGLADSLPGLKPEICRSIEMHPNIQNEMLINQWEHLVFQPLLELDRRILTPLTSIIVIDAFDECESESESDIDTILQLIARAQKLNTIHLKFFITSRPELNIISSFNAIVDDLHAAELNKVLVSRDKNAPKDDITKFLEHEIAIITRRKMLTADWPGEGKIQELAWKADGLFIYAATACRFLSDRRLTKERLKSRLDLLLDGKVVERSPQKGLDDIYSRILQFSVIGDAIEEEKEDIRNRFQVTVGAIVMLFEPLSATALGNMLSVPESTITETLQCLLSVLSVSEEDKPIRLLHLSFRDFLLDPQRCVNENFWISQKKKHVSDGRRFVLKFRSIIEIAPLQLYRSALLYCPELSIIRQTYKHLVPKWIISSPTVERRWSPLLQTLEDQQALYDVAFSPDGKIVASSSVCLYDAATGTLLKTLDALSEDSNRSEGSAVAFSRDGKRVISISWQGALRVWDVSSGLIISEVKSAVVGTTAFWRIFSRDRTLAVALLNSNTVEVIDIANGRILKTFQPHGENAVDSLALSQDGQHLASASKNGAIQLWNTVTAAPRHELKRPFEDMLLETRLAFSPDGKWLAALSKLYAISLWNPANGEFMGEIPGWFYDACFLPDSNVLVTSCETKDGDSGLVKLWDVSSRKLLKAIPANCLGLQLSPDGRYLTSAPLRHGAYDSQGGGRRINVWDINTGMIHKVFHSPSDDLSCLTFSNDNKLLASASDFNGTIQLWDLVTHSQFLHDSQQDGIDSFKLSPNRKIAASITIPYSKVRLWDMETGALRGEVSGGVSSFSPDGRWFVTSNGKTDDIYNVATMELVHSAEKLDPKRPGRFAFSPDSKFLAQDFSDPVSHMAEDRANEIYAEIPDDQPIVRIWDAETWKLLFTFEARYNRITAMKFSPDSTLLAGAVFRHLDRPRAKETSFIIWDVLNGCRQRIVTVPVFISECWTADLAWSPDGTTVALLTTDRKVRLCHVASGQVKTLDLQERGISVAFSSDGLLLAAGSMIQGSIELWDVHTRTRIGIRKALGFHHWLQFSEDCKSIETDHGCFDVDAFYPGQELARKRDFLIEYDWVIYGGERILLLPIDYRTTCAVAVNDLLLMGHASGRVTSLRIDATSFGSI
ncbi:uncharacterized protein N7484_006427 [Penicillium longicatenatum]|uniref:uncharacterized protein n=1 Tax=Penicillium longicatenatum TaxID=1561947 RepID=UPI0025469361|nr:uncharacterized protein N7484_006427 [Penicillium longicatenatum]KAJ5643920.1 hypothetical protein N7484_006427 [Penicillium longicatenatum]